MRLVDRAFRAARLVPLVVGLLLPALGMTQGVRPGRAGGPGGPGGQGVPRMDDLRETITILMMVRMKNELNLTKEQHEQILPRIEEFEKARAAAFQSRRDLDIRLKGLFMQSTPQDSEFLDIVDKLNALDEADHRREQAYSLEIRKLLNPRQQAQFLLFRQRFRGWLEERMREMREMRPQGPGRPGFGAGRGRGFDPEALGDETAGPAAPAPPR